MVSLSLHANDTSIGRAAAGLTVTVERQEDDRWLPFAKVTTDKGGRVPHITGDAPLLPGRYRLTFASGEYYQLQGLDCIFPELTATVSLAAEEHYHVVLKLGRFGFDVSRGS